MGLAGNAGSPCLNIGNYRKGNARFGNAGIENEPVCYSRILVCENRFAPNALEKIVGKLTQNEALRWKSAETSPVWTWRLWK